MTYRTFFKNNLLNSNEKYPLSKWSIGFSRWVYNHQFLDLQFDCSYKFQNSEWKYGKMTIFHDQKSILFDSHEIFFENYNIINDPENDLIILNHQVQIKIEKALTYNLVCIVLYYLDITKIINSQFQLFAFGKTLSVHESILEYIEIKNIVKRAREKLIETVNFEIEREIRPSDILDNSIIPLLDEHCNEVSSKLLDHTPLKGYKYDKCDNSGYMECIKLQADVVLFETDSFLESQTAVDKKSDRAFAEAQSKIKSANGVIISSDWLETAAVMAYQNHRLKSSYKKAEKFYNDSVQSIVLEEKNKDQSRITAFKKKIFHARLLECIDLFVKQLAIDYLDILKTYGLFDTSVLKYTHLTEAKKTIDAGNDEAYLQKAYTECPYCIDVYLKTIKLGIFDADLANIAKTLTIDADLIDSVFQEHIFVYKDSNSFKQKYDLLKENIDGISILSGMKQKEILKDFAEPMHKKVVDFYKELYKYSSNKSCCYEFIEKHFYGSYKEDTNHFFNKIQQYVTSAYSQDTIDLLQSQCGYKDLLIEINNLRAQNKKIDIDNSYIEAICELERNIRPAFKEIDQLRRCKNKILCERKIADQTYKQAKKNKNSNEPMRILKRKVDVLDEKLNYLDFEIQNKLAFNENAINPYFGEITEGKRQDAVEITKYRIANYRKENIKFCGLAIILLILGIILGLNNGVFFTFILIIADIYLLFKIVKQIDLITSEKEDYQLLTYNCENCEQIIIEQTVREKLQKCPPNWKSVIKTNEKFNSRKKHLQKPIIIGAVAFAVVCVGLIVYAVVAQKQMPAKIESTLTQCAESYGLKDVAINIPEHEDAYNATYTITVNTSTQLKNLSFDIIVNMHTEMEESIKKYGGPSVNFYAPVSNKKYTYGTYTVMHSENEWDEDKIEVLVNDKETIYYDGWKTRKSGTKY